MFRFLFTDSPGSCSSPRIWDRMTQRRKVLHNTHRDLCFYEGTINFRNNSNLRFRELPGAGTVLKKIGFFQVQKNCYGEKLWVVPEWSDLSLGQVCSKAVSWNFQVSINEARAMLRGLIVTLSEALRALIDPKTHDTKADDGSFQTG